MYHIGLVPLPHAALPNGPNPKPWYRHLIGTSKASLRMDSKFMDWSTHIDRPDDKPSSPTSTDKSNCPNWTYSNETTSSNDKGKSPEQAMPKTPSPNSKSKVTIEDFNSADENEDNDYPTNPKVNIVKSKKRSPDADPEDEQDCRKITYTGFSDLYEPASQLKDAGSLPSPPDSDEKKMTNNEHMDSNPKSPTRASKNKTDEEVMQKSPSNSSTSSNDTHVKSPSPDTIKITFSSSSPSPPNKSHHSTSHEQTTFLTTLPSPLSDAKFTIPILDTRDSLLLASIDLAARFDNKFHFTEYSNSLLRQEAEEKGRKIEELEWKVRCLGQEGKMARKDKGVLEGKMRDLQFKFGEMGKENRGLKRELGGERSEVKERGDEIEGLKGELAGGKEGLEALEKRGDFVFGDAEEEIARLGGKVEELEKGLKGVNGDLAGAEDENSGLKERIVELEELLSVETMKFSEENMKLMDREEKVFMLENEVEMLQERKGECEVACDGLRGDLDYANAQNRELEKTNERLEKDLVSEKKECQHLGGLVGAGKDAKALEERINDLQKENAELKKAATNLESDVLNHRTRATEMINMLEGLIYHPVRQALGDIRSSAANKQIPTRGQPYGPRDGRGSHKFVLADS